MQHFIPVSCIMMLNSEVIMHIVHYHLGHSLMGNEASFPNLSDPILKKKKRHILRQYWHGHHFIQPWTGKSPKPIGDWASDSEWVRERERERECESECDSECVSQWAREKGWEIEGERDSVRVRVRLSGHWMKCLWPGQEEGISKGNRVTQL